MNLDFIKLMIAADNTKLSWAVKTYPHNTCFDLILTDDKRKISFESISQKVNWRQKSKYSGLLIMGYSDRLSFGCPLKIAIGIKDKHCAVFVSDSIWKIRLYAKNGHMEDFLLEQADTSLLGCFEPFIKELTKPQ